MSINEIKQIEQDIVKLAKDRELTYENAFNLGVRLGRHLEKNNLDNIKLDYFQEQDKADNLRKRFGALHGNVLGHLEKLLFSSIKEHIIISKFKSWSTGFEERLTDDAYFAQVIESKRNIQFVKLSEDESEHHFIANFVLTGKIAELFEKFHQPIHFQIIIDDEASERHIDILSDKDLAKFYGLSADYNCEITDSSVDDYEDFVKSLDRRLIFMTIENP